MMKISFHCPACDLPIHLSRWESLEDFHCPACGKAIPAYVDAEAKEKLNLQHCLICNGPDLFKQKAFNRNVGLGIVVVGIILSFWTYGISLLVVAAFDFILYRALGSMSVCYCCDAEFRGFKNSEALEPFDHLKAAAVKKNQ